MNILDIQGLGITDPSDKPHLGYYPGNNTGDPKFRILGKNKMILYVSQTLIKAFTHLGEIKNYCPKKIYEELIANNIDWPPSNAMKAGSYFETKVIGSGANGAKLTEYHKKGRGGKVSVEQTRIDEQAMLAKVLLAQKGGLVYDDFSNAQVVNSKMYPQENWPNITVMLTGEADLITPLKHDGREFDLVCVDYKLTSDLHSPFGPYGWGKVFDIPEGGKIFMDLTQSTVYHLLFDMPFAYWVFDYKAKGPENILAFVNHDINHPNKIKANQAKWRLREFRQTMNLVVNEIGFNFQKGWPTNNSDPDNCSKCGVKDCPDREEFKSI